MSKLAALAAARKKKSDEKSENSKAASSSVALLDKLGSKAKDAQTNDSTHSSADVKEPSQSTRKYPRRKREIASPKPTPKAPEPAQKADTTVPEPEEACIPILSTPSAFGRTMLGSSSESRDNPSNDSLHFTPEYLGVDFTEFNPFAGPSPDDIVANAQKSAKGLAR